MDTQALARKIAREWFKAHPRSVVLNHWREKEINMEMMRLPRDATVRGNRVVFGPHQSEMDLMGITSADATIGGQLCLQWAPHSFVTYKAC
jgi:hypothetical protein